MIRIEMFFWVHDGVGGKRDLGSHLESVDVIAEEIKDNSILKRGTISVGGGDKQPRAAQQTKGIGKNTKEEKGRGETETRNGCTDWERT